MKYLLDVNALVAMFHPTHPHYARLHDWYARQSRVEMASCAICDLGFIRVSMRAYSFTLQMAEEALEGTKQRNGIAYIETAPKPRLASWVLAHRQTTDAYLCQLAAANGMMLATFDAGIKDAAAVLIS